ncbi:MAG: methionine--tRNA ligase [Candidatus Omnitrophica bacterium]|nr:methionine--tRNA ligase [Candidatus Omnitrophota bacterium]
MANKFYLTTPLYYINAQPHIGHSYTTIAADTIARCMRNRYGQQNVWFLTGTDEHGQKIQRAAQASGLDTLSFADRVVLTFKELWKILGISYNDFIRTTEERHKKVVQRVLSILKEKNDIYQAQYEGWYCTPCESFWAQSQLKDNLCPDCQRPVEYITEKNYFFRLSIYQDWLMDYLKRNPLFVRPQIRYNEVVRFLEENRLEDLCISRPKERLSWGIPIPFDSDYVTYVWFDALINYISAVGDFDEKGQYHSLWWPADLQLIGKDILRQHAIYWPIMLHALGIQPPKTICAHGWWLSQETKMSKSRGNVISPVELTQKYSADGLRYFLLRDVPFGLDGNFSEEAIVKRYNSDLANDLGNLVYRTLSMIEKYFSGTIPEIDIWTQSLSKQAEEIKFVVRRLPEDVFKILQPENDFNFSLALERIWELINKANKYIEETKPWNLLKENKKNELALFMRFLVEIIRAINSELSAFMPQTAAFIQQQIGQKVIKKSLPLFPRIETE